MMTNKKIAIKVVSPEGIVHDGEANFVNIRGAEGELGLSYGHSPLLTSIPPGILRIENEGMSDEMIYVQGGALEVQATQVIVLSDVAERAMDINEAQAYDAKKRAETLLKSTKNQDKLKLEEAHILLAEASAKIRLLEFIKKQRG